MAYFRNLKIQEEVILENGCASMLCGLGRGECLWDRIFYKPPTGEFCLCFLSHRPQPLLIVLIGFVGWWQHFSLK